MTFNPLMVVQPEGVYVYDGGVVETVRLFGHDSTYIRTVYPFPAGDELVIAYGCRNGGFCGVLMAGSTEEIKGLRAAVGEVTGPGGKWYGWKEDRYYATFPLADAAMGGRRAG